MPHPTRFIAILLFILGLSTGAYAIDRLLLDDWTTLDVRIINQNAESVTYIQEDGTTNTVSKAEIRGIQLNVAEDKFYAAAQEEADPDRQLLLLKKSTERYPKDRLNFNMLVRVNLREMKLAEAEKYLTNASLSHVGFDLLKALHVLKSKDGKSAAEALDRANRKSWTAAHRAQESLIYSFAKADQRQYKETLNYLNAIEKQFQPAQINAAYSNLMAYYTYDHYKKSLYSLVYLKEKNHRSRTQLEVMHPNITRYYRRPAAPPANVEWVEKIVLVEQRASEGAEAADVVIGSLLTGLSASSFFFAGTYLSDYIEARSRYERALDSTALNGYSSNAGTSSSTSSDSFDWSKPDEVFANLGNQSSSAIRRSQATGTLTIAYTGIGVVTGGIGTLFLLNAANEKGMAKIKHRRPPPHLTFKDDPNRMSGQRFTSGYARLTFLAALPFFALNAKMWNDTFAVRNTAYKTMQSSDSELYTYMYNQAAQAMYRTDFYRGMTIGLSVASLASGILFIINPFPKGPQKTGFLYPSIQPDGFNLTYVNTF
ncbi:MAG: hypothetical protein JNM63_10155 [Spirochaetia bacterium]|nr:hypothetical protein [Spirochaetia bacterium]